MDITLYYGWYVPEPDRTVRDTAFPIFSFEVVCDNTPPKTTNPGAKIPEICDAEMVIPLAVFCMEFKQAGSCNTGTMAWFFIFGNRLV